ncbi:transmembrane protein 144-like isoform X2 [Lingula anatina]|nr:transmembrane protein 144-like isoform X2 [Lingula anatina]|eukprot:XP_013387125.1 transmembrane protein 144-like isoform X2 [Lingula anatina]
MEASCLTKTHTSEESFPEYVGFICAGVAVVLFGSNFVPVKKFETGDGMFFQWVLCSAIWCVGLIVNAMRGFPPFYPLSMFGGFLWATGNITVVPILKTIGLGLGILIWGTFNLLSGWASGRFGWFGIHPELPTDVLLNDLGVTLAALRGLFFMLVKSEVSAEEAISLSDNTTDIEKEALTFRDPNMKADSPHSDTNHSIPKTPANINYGSAREFNEIEILDRSQNETFIDRMTPIQKKIMGTSMAVVAGVFYGLSFTPDIFIQDHANTTTNHTSFYPGASENGLDYVFGQFSGIYATSTLYFIIYCIVMKNKPRVYPRAILPALASGTMWGVACSCWFVANKSLSEPVSFPIITTGPGLIAALWGIVVFREVKMMSRYQIEIGGTQINFPRNFIIVSLAFAVTIAGAILSAFSKA